MSIRSTRITTVRYHLVCTDQLIFATIVFTLQSETMASFKPNFVRSLPSFPRTCTPETYGKNTHRDEKTYRFHSVQTFTV